VETLDTLSGALGQTRRRSADEAQLHVAMLGSAPSSEPSRHRLRGIDEIALVRGDRRDVARSGPRLVLALPDPFMSSNHARIVRRPDGFVLEDLGSKNGSFVNGAPASEGSTLDADDVIEVGRTFLILDPRCTTFEADPDDAKLTELGAPLPELATFSAAFREELETLGRVAASDLPILLLGETGTGKEVVARAIHRLSERKGELVAVNVAALPETLVEAELFGAKRGAYSGADEDRPGLVRAADRGTLLLDEIGDLPISPQAAFLRVLQEREVLPIGDTKTVRVAFRLVSATHRALEPLVSAGRFREDLLARIGGLVVRLPPLRQRKADLGFLIGRVLADLGASEITMSALAGRALLRHPWPRNVRELVHVLSRAVALAREGVIELDHLPPEIQRSTTTPPVLNDASPDDPRKAELIRLLERHRGNISAVAREMGCARMQIHRWLKTYRLDPGSFRGEPE
jgi:transcriptional regulator with PAS, ATPase and Fis domain